MIRQTAGIRGYAIAAILGAAVAVGLTFAGAKDTAIGLQCRVSFPDPDLCQDCAKRGCDGAYPPGSRPEENRNCLITAFADCVN